MAVFDNADAVTAANATSITFTNFAVGSDSDRLLVVHVGVREQTESFTVVSDVTFNSASITFVRRQIETGTFDSASELWELLAPANVTADIVVTMAGECASLKLNAASFGGVKNQTAETRTGGGANSDGGIPSGSTITTVTANALIVVNAHIIRTGVWTAGTNYTLGSSMSANGGSQGDEYDLDAGGSGSKTVDMEKDGTSGRVTWCAAAYELAAAGGTTPKGPLGHPLHGAFGGPV